MRQNWWHLLFLHWELPAEVIQGRLPAELELNTYNGRAYVGLVPFTMTGVRFWWSPPLPGVSRFHEVNVRTYVMPRGGGPPGVWFFSLDAASLPAVEVARHFWNLPYQWARMSLRREGDRMLFTSQRRGPASAACRIVFQPQDAPAPALPGSLDAFLIERYVLYCKRGAQLLSGRVRHDPYQVCPVRIDELSESLLAASGLPRPEGPPLAHYAAGVRVRVDRLAVWPRII